MTKNMALEPLSMPMEIATKEIGETANAPTKESTNIQTATSTKESGTKTAKKATEN